MGITTFPFVSGSLKNYPLERPTVLVTPTESILSFIAFLWNFFPYIWDENWIAKATIKEDHSIIFVVLTCTKKHKRVSHMRSLVSEILSCCHNYGTRMLFYTSQDHKILMSLYNSNFIQWWKSNKYNCKLKQVWFLGFKKLKNCTFSVLC